MSEVDRGLIGSEIPGALIELSVIFPGNSAKSWREFLHSVVHTTGKEVLHTWRAENVRVLSR